MIPINSNKSCTLKLTLKGRRNNGRAKWSYSIRTWVCTVFSVLFLSQQNLSMSRSRVSLIGARPRPVAKSAQVPFKMNPGAHITPCGSKVTWTCTYALSPAEQRKDTCTLAPGPRAEKEMVWRQELKFHDALVDLTSLKNPRIGLHDDTAW